MYVVGFGLVCISAQVFFSYERTVRLLKWLTLVLFSYVAVVLTVHIPWRTVMIESLVPWSFLPEHTLLKDYAAMVVAVLGTTISPYLFFWQSAQEVEDNNRRPHSAELHHHPEYVREHLSRIKQDTFIGMSFSNLIALCIVISTAVTLNMQGVSGIETSAQAALALKPVAGEFAFLVLLFVLGGRGYSAGSLFPR